MYIRCSHWYLRLILKQNSISQEINQQVNHEGFLVNRVSSLWWVSLLLLNACGGGGGGISTSYPQQPANLPSLPYARLSANEISNQQGVTQVNADYTIQNGYHGENITIGIVDTGIDESHAELEGKVRDGGDWQYGVSGLIDHNGHGTHVAAIAAAKLNGSGMVGIAPKASLKSYKLFNEDGSSGGINFQNALSQVIDSAASSDVSILNNSWANPESMESIFTGGFSVSVQNELPLWRRAVNDGKVLVFAAGNESRTQPSLHSGLPAYDPDLAKGWLAVVAVDLNQKQTLYSNRCGLAADWCLAAPGGGNNPKADGIISARVGGYYTRMSGTSMAAPHVSGGLAVVMSAFPSLTAQSAAERLLESASYEGLQTLSGCTLTKCGEERIKTYFGRGQMNLKAALSPLGPLTIAGSDATAASSSLSLSPVLHNSIAHLFKGLEFKAIDSFDRAVFKLNGSHLIHMPNQENQTNRSGNNLLLLNPSRKQSFSLLQGNLDQDKNAHSKSKLMNLSSNKDSVAIDHIHYSDAKMPVISRLHIQKNRTSIASQIEQNREMWSWWLGNGIAAGKNNWVGSRGENAFKLGSSKDFWVFSGVRYDTENMRLQADAIYGSSYLQGGKMQVIRAAKVNLLGWSLTGQIPISPQANLSLGVSSPIQPLNGGMSVAGLSDTPSELTYLKIDSNNRQQEIQIGYNVEFSEDTRLSISHKKLSYLDSVTQSLTEISLEVKL